MRILAEGLQLLNSPFIHVDYVSSTNPISDPLYMGLLIGVISVVVVGWILVIYFLVREHKKKKEGKG